MQTVTYHFGCFENFSHHLPCVCEDYLRVRGTNLINLIIDQEFFCETNYKNSKIRKVKYDTLSVFLEWL